MHHELPEALRDRLSYLLGRAYRDLLAAESAALTSAGSSVKGHAALEVLRDEGPVTQQALGRRLGIDRTTTVAVVDAIERAGFVDRSRDPADRRSYRLTLTTAGQRSLGRAGRAVAKAERDALPGLDAAERSTLMRLLAQAIEVGP